MIGKKYKHHRNKLIYTVVEIIPLKLNDKWTTAVVYEGADMNVWSRPIDNFKEKFAEVENNN
jgi:hypothetical protein